MEEERKEIYQELLGKVERVSDMVSPTGEVVTRLLRSATRTKERDQPTIEDFLRFGRRPGIFL